MVSSSLLLSLPCSAVHPRCPLLPKLPLTHAKRSQVVVVSCSADNPKQGRVVDRRNMLLGLGGLAGAASLAPTQGASGSPIDTPELDMCGLSSYKDLTTGKQIDLSCCPPLGSEKAIDYQLPPYLQMRTRPAAQRVTAEYACKYNTAVDRMKRLPDSDPRSFKNQANIHCVYCNDGYTQQNVVDDGKSFSLQVHSSWLFFPFHRWYLYFHERILGKLIGDPTFALPFWNWDNPKGMTMPEMFNDPLSALYNPKRNPYSAHPSTIVDLGMTDVEDNTLQLVANNLTVMYTEMIRGNNSTYDFMGKPYPAGTKAEPGAGSCERGSHSAIHSWMGDPRESAGEDMGNFYSAGRDPLFYSHHANVDRMWTLWQHFLPSDKIDNKEIDDPDFLNTSFLFYDENKQLVRVTVEDCIDNLRMGYDFERIDLPWLDFRPPHQTATAKIMRASSTAPKASTIFPLNLDRVVRFKVDRLKKRGPDVKELLVLDNITVDPTKTIKFDVFVNDEDDNPKELDKASYAGSYAQVPHKSKDNKTVSGTISLNLANVYEDMDVEGDDTIIVTLVPRHKGPGVTIGGIKIIEAPPTRSTPAAAAPPPTTTTPPVDVDLAAAAHENAVAAAALDKAVDASIADAANSLARQIVSGAAAF